LCRFLRALVGAFVLGDGAWLTRCAQAQAHAQVRGFINTLIESSEFATLIASSHSSSEKP
jgi:hypothetical protein